MPHAADPVLQLLEEERGKILLARVRGGLWILFLAIGIYGVGEAFVRPDSLSRLFAYRAYLLGEVLVAYVLVRLRTTPRWVTGVALVTFGAMCLSTTASSNYVGDIGTMTVLSVVLVLLSAAVFPWGVWPHGAVVAMVAVATFWNVYHVQGMVPPVFVLPGAAVLGIWFGSFYLRHEMARNRRAVAREAHERLRAEEQARQHQASLAHVARVSMMGEMAAQMAHELNQPLSAIVSYASGCIRRIRNGSERPEEILEALDQIAGQAVRASEILKRLRAFVRKGAPKRERVHINAVVRNALRFAEVEARDYGVSVRFEPAPYLPVIQADAVQLEQVVLNLVRNGFEAMRETNGRQRELVIRTGLDDHGFVRVSVRDSGAGVAADIADTLFEPFTTTKPDGLGMGLSISRSIIESHGGRLWMTQNAGAGATFEFTVPVAEGGHEHEQRADRFRRR